MSTPSRTQLISNLDQSIQRWGNLNVLFTNCIAAHVGLSATEFECVSLLKDEGPLTAGELSRRSGLTTGAITGLIDRLEKVGVAERRPDPTDRRRVMVHMTPNPAVGAKINHLYAPVSQTFYQTVGQYTDAELSTILSFINRCVESTLALSEQLQVSHGHKSTPR